MINKILLHIIILCSLSFYNIAFLGPKVKYFDLLGVMLILFILVIYIVYSKPIQFKKYFTWPIVVTMTGVLLSTGFCKIYYGQSILYTFWEQKEMFLYLGYFMIHMMKPDPKDIEKIISLYAIIFIAFYFLQYILYPTVIFDVDMREDRNTIRIALPGSIFMLIGYFMFLQKFMQTNKPKYFIFCFLILLAVILLGGRQLISILSLMTILGLIFSKRIKSRGFIYFLIMVGFIPMYFIFYNIFVELTSATITNLTHGNEDIRLKTLRFFLLDSFPNTVSYITGNGAPSITSSYGRGLSAAAGKYKFFLSDIGIIGNYFVYGLFFVLGVLFIFLRTARLKILPGQYYTRYLFASLFLLIPMGGGFAYGEFIFPIMLVLYVIDVSNYQFVTQSTVNNQIKETAL
jgi:hypothetical protein